MPFLDAWTHPLISPTHMGFFVLALAVAGAVTFINTTGNLLPRLGGAAATAAAFAVVGPLLVSPAFLSAGVWTWGLALLGASSLVACATIRAVRASLGCVLTTRTEWALWLVGIVVLWTALVLTGAFTWALAFLVTAVALYLVVHFLPGHASPSGTNVDLIRTASLLAAPVAITGVAWAGVPIALTATAAALWSRTRKNDVEREQVSRLSVVALHLIASFLPVALLALGAPALPVGAL